MKNSKKILIVIVIIIIVAISIYFFNKNEGHNIENTGELNTENKLPAFKLVDVDGNEVTDEIFSEYKSLFWRAGSFKWNIQGI